MFRLLLEAVLLAASAAAQTSTLLTGTVTDASGVSVAGATVTAENVATGARRTATTDASGVYAFPHIIPGTYTLTTATGFSTSTASDVRVLVNTPTTVNVTLTVGAVTQSVEVSAEAVQVNTTDASVGNAFGTLPIVQLPLEARNVVGLLSLQPGVVYIGENYRNDSRSGSVNGGRSDQANVTLDGVDVNNQQDRHAFTSVLRVTPDSVQEFRVTTTNANADQAARPARKSPWSRKAAATRCTDHSTSFTATPSRPRTASSITPQAWRVRS